MKNLGNFVFYVVREAQIKAQMGLFVLILLLFGACTEGMLDDDDVSNDLDLLSQNLSREFGKLGVSDAANGGRVDEFYFLFPEPGKDRKFYGKFHSNLQPIVEISDDLSFQNVHASFSREGTTNGKVLLNSQEESYSISWNPSQTQAQVGKIYRLRVRIGERVLGHIDFGIVPSSNTKKLQDGLIPAVQNQMMRISVRIEEKECPARIVVEPAEATVKVDETKQYTAKVYNFYDELLDGLSINWETEDMEIATVDDNGLATGKKFGFTRVKASVLDVSGEAFIFVQEAGGEAPRPGKDVVVFNDFNVFDNNSMANDNNKLFVRNLVDFSTPGIRNEGTVVMFDCGRNSVFVTNDTPPACQGNTARWIPMRKVITDAGYTIQDISSTSGSLVNIDEDVKVLFLWLPRVAYTLAEINSLKEFAEEGGRIIFVGEWDGFYTNVGLAVENQFLVNMGAVMRNVGQAIDCGYNVLPLSSLRPHPITRDLTNLTMGCASVIELGPNDFPLFFDLRNQVVLSGVAQIDTNPLTELIGARILPTDQSRMRILGELDPTKSTGF